MSKTDKDEDFTIGYIWTWLPPASSKPKDEKKVRASLVLPYGYLVENADATIQGIGSSMRWTALLYNGDLVIGPDMIAIDKDSREAAAQELKDFKADIIYLKRAMAHGTIQLNMFHK